jgi:hypothetical protein
MNPLPAELANFEMQVGNQHDSAQQSLHLNRRHYPRIQNPFPARVCGVNTEGVPFEFHTRIDNLSVTGLYLRVPEQIKECSELEVKVQFSDNFGEGTAIQVKGIILRAEPKPGMIYGIAVKFLKHKFLWK